MKKINILFFTFFCLLILSAPGVAFADMIIFPALIPVYFIFSNPLILIPLPFLLLFIVSLIETIVFIKWVSHRSPISPDFLKSLLFIIFANIVSSLAGVLASIAVFSGGAIFSELVWLSSISEFIANFPSSNLLAQINSSQVGNPLSPSLPSTSELFALSILAVIAIISTIPTFFMFFLPIKNFNFMSFFGERKKLASSIISIFLVIFSSLVSFPLIGLVLVVGIAWFFSSLIEAPFFANLARKYFPEFSTKESLSLSFLINSASYLFFIIIYIPFLLLFLPYSLSFLSQ